MKVLKNYEEFISEAIRILQKERGDVRVSSFNLSVRNEDTKQFLDLTLAARSSIMIGTLYRTCTEACPACEAANQKRSNSLAVLAKNYNIRITDNLHLKYISRGNKAIVGGINLTGSNFDDMALLITDPAAIQSMNDYFDSVYRKVTSKPQYLYVYIKPVFPIGRHKGKTVDEVQAIDPSYIIWAKRNLSKFILNGLGL